MKALARLLALLLLALPVFAACGGQNDTAQIKAVIEKADHEQEDAFAAHDPSLMEDTSTARNFAYMARTNDAIASQGAVGIRLDKLEWGAITISSSTTATAQTWETWETTGADGSSQTDRQQDIYKLVKVGGAWKVDEIDYPDIQQTPTSSEQPSASSAPG